MTRALSIAAGVGLAATLALGAFWAAPSVEDDVRDRVTATLAPLPDVAVEVDGRDVRLSGPLPAGVTPDQTLAAVATIDAVRSVSDDGLLVTEAASEPIDVSEPSLAVVVSARDAEISGEVFDRDQLAALLEATQRTAPTVVSRLIVSDGLPSEDADRQVEAVTDLLMAAGSDLGVGTVTLADGLLTVTTSVPDEAARGRLTRLIDASGLESSIDVTVGPADTEGNSG